MAGRLLGFTCVLLLCGLLCAGLAPFHSPPNEVIWVSGANALRFGEYGVIVGSRRIPPSRANGRTLEIWMQPGRVEDSNTILAFFDPGALGRLSLQQSDRDLKLQIAPSQAWSLEKTSKLYVDDAFRNREKAFLTVTSDSSGTSIYRDGIKLRESREFRISTQDFSGRLVVGTSPIFNENWKGTLLGLAVYDSALSAVRVARHYRNWTTRRSPGVDAEDACIALYLFDEHSGRVVHDKIGSATDLLIPKKYLILDQTVLDPVWRAFDWSWGFWKDAIINVGGFVPPGFFLCAYLSIRRLRRPALGASLMGTVISLSIELLQSHLPTRDSSMADVINNAAGSAVGAALYQGRFGELFDRSVARCVALLSDGPAPRPKSQK
jgi:VanZ like family/Concanavalin A-like lectin/glucanases superfamily